MDDVYKALFGVGGFAMAIIGLVLRINHTNSGKFKDVHNRIESGDKELSTKIDKVKDDYVKVRDLDTHLKPIHDSIERNWKDQKDDHREIMQLLNKKQ